MTIAEYLLQLNSIRNDLDGAIEALGATPGPRFATFASSILDRADAIIASLAQIAGEAQDDIDEALTSIADSKNELYDAIVAKGGTLAEDAPLSDYADAVDGISAGEFPAGISFAFSLSISLDFSDIVFPDAATRTDTQYMFYNCSALQTLTLPEGFGAAITNAYSMFYYCVALQSLTLPEGFGAAITNAYSMFDYCIALQTLTLPEGFGAAITNAYNMFSYCVALQSLTLPEGFGAAITSASAMFQGCRHLQTISKFSLASVSNTSQAFYSCSALENVGGFTGLKISLSLSSAIHLTLQSVVNIVTEAAAVNTAQTLTLHANAYARAQADTEVYEYNGNTYTGIIALANAKGWTIASA